jgi:hypothetical protein
VYRTNNAETANAPDVTWSPISGDLTSGCPAAANGARGCLISAIGVADGGDGVRRHRRRLGPGQLECRHRRPAGIESAGTLPDRPVDQFAVDRSNWRSPTWRTVASGRHAGQQRPRVRDVRRRCPLDNITANLPDVPVNSILIDPADAKTLYVGTDVGAFFTTNGGQKWFNPRSAMPRLPSGSSTTTPRTAS